MFTQAVAVAAAAALFAPPVYADADAPAAATPAVPPGSPFASCSEKLGPGGSHSLSDILETFSTDQLAGEDSVLAPLLEELSPATTEILGEFDVTGETSYTLLMPFNMDKMGNPLTEEYDLNSTAVVAAADDIITAHILPGTLNFQTLQEETNATGMYTVESLQGFEWTFGWNMGDEGGFPFIVDEWNVTTDGMIEIQPDIRTVPDCPNVIIGINGFVVTPDLLTEAPAPATVPPPAATPPPATPTTAGAPVEPVPESSTPAPGTDSSAAGSFVASGLAALTAVGAAALGAALL